MAAIAATLGTLGGLGGAVLLVPILVASGTDPLVAAPIGLVVVAAGALAAGPGQLARGVVHHRLGLTIEIPAAMGALIGATWSVHAPDSALRIVLTVVVVAAAIAGIARPVQRNIATAEFVAEPAAEWPGTLGGTYHGPGGSIPYRARRVPLGLGVMAAAGAVSGLAGVGGGFIKTPVMRDIMWIPIKVAAATSTFTVGITATTALIIFAGQGRLDPSASAAAALGGILGGLAGTRLQEMMSPNLLRRVLAVLLLGVAAVLAVGT
jgi:uncharacterized protein